MKCKEAANLISDYIDGVLAESKQREFEAHIGQCESCKLELRAMESLVGSLRSLSGAKCSVDCWSAVERRITKDQQSFWNMLFQPAYLAPLAAALLILAVVLVWPGASQVENHGRPKQAIATAPLKTEAPVERTQDYSSYIGVHSRYQREQPFADADVTFVSAELERVSFTSSSTGR